MGSGELCQETWCSSPSGDAFVRELLELHKGFQVPFRVSEGTWDFSQDAAVRNGPHLAQGENPWFFLRLGGKFGVPSRSCNEPQDDRSHCLSGKSGLILSCDGRIEILSCHCKGNRPHLDMCPETPRSSEMAWSPLRGPKKGVTLPISFERELGVTLGPAGKVRPHLTMMGGICGLS